MKNAFLCYTLNTIKLCGLVQANVFQTPHSSHSELVNLFNFSIEPKDMITTNRNFSGLEQERSCPSGAGIN